MSCCRWVTRFARRCTDAIDEMATDGRIPRLWAVGRLRLSSRSDRGRTSSEVVACGSTRTRSTPPTARNATAPTSRRSSPTSATLAVSDPVYPVYVDTNVMAGRTGDPDESRGATAEFSICRAPRKVASFPNCQRSRSISSTCVRLTTRPERSLRRTELQKWVDWARANESIILFDAAYERFISEDVPHSIFEIDGAHASARSSSEASRRRRALRGFAARTS